MILFSTFFPIFGEKFKSRFRARPLEPKLRRVRSVPSNFESIEWLGVLAAAGRVSVVGSEGWGFERPAISELHCLHTATEGWTQWSIVLIERGSRENSTQPGEGGSKSLAQLEGVGGLTDCGRERDDEGG